MTALFLSNCNRKSELAMFLEEVEQLLHPATIWEKCSVDFVREDGNWKIWHFRQYGDIGAQLDQSLLDSSRPMPPRTAFPVPSPQGKEHEMFKNMPQPYSTKRVADFSPALPQPYESWDDSLSCVK